MSTSQDELNVSVEIEEIPIKLSSEVPTVNATLSPPDNVIVLGSSTMGPQGPPGPAGQWTALTQSEYDALDPPDPETLYVIIE